MLPQLAPAGDEASEAVLAAAMALAGKRVVALTGAGISTESGIPDYRGPETRKRARSPMRFAQFVADDAARRRYWARATLGWPRVRDALANAGHAAIARADVVRGGSIAGVITQNVDGLHQEAGSARVVELHGALRDVVCLGCGVHESRERLHERILDVNPGFRSDRVAAHGPDGDVDVSDDVVASFVPVACLCGGPYKPRVVFFGENVPVDVVSDAWALLDEAGALLVVGSSLEVYSGRRFVERAHARGLPIVIVNLGPTRSDALATVVVDGRAGAILAALFPAPVR